MWARFRTSVIKRDKHEMLESHKSFNINDEYLCAVRTKSYAEFFSKAQLLVSEHPTSSPTAYRHCKLSEVLLDPGQETITRVLESSNKSSNLKALLFDFFNVSAEASNFCSHLLNSLTQIRTDYKFIHQVVDTAIQDHEQFDYIFSKLTILKNPFAKQDFSRIHQKHSLVLQHLKSKRKRVTRKIKLIKYFNKISGVCITAACGLLTAAAVALAAHTLTVLLMGPVLVSLPVKPLKKKFLEVRFSKYEFLRKIREQLDVAAKGTYILNRDFDTMSRLVSRLQDEIEHNKTMIRFCLDRREDKLSCQVLKELKKCESGFMKQVEELEEHVYLCLVTINRARALVINEISNLVDKN